MASIKVPAWMIGALFFLALMTRVVCFVGLIGSDDLTYSRQAYAIASGTFVPQADNQVARIGLFLPVAGLFKLFGVHEISAVMVPFFCSVITMSLVYWMGRTQLGPWTGVLAGLVYAFLPIDIFHATILLPDLPSATWMTVSALLFYRSEHHISREKQGLGMLLSGLILGYAYLVKETSVFLGVFLGGYIAYRWWRQKRFSLGWLWFLGGAAVCVGLEFGYYAWTTGTPFFRYVAVRTARSGSIFSGQNLQGLNLTVRLTVQMFYFLFHVPDFSLLYVFALAGGLYSRGKNLPFIRFLAGWLFVILALYNFASASFSAYDPLMLFHRFFLASSFPATLLAAWFLHEAGLVLFSEQRPAELRQMRLALGAPTVLLFIITVIWFSWLTAAALLVALSSLALTIVPPKFCQAIRRARHGRQASLGISATLLVIIILPGIVMSARGERIRKGLTCERELFSVFEQPLQRMIYTDSRTAEILEFLYQYRYDDWIAAFPNGPSSNPAMLRNAYVIANWERLFFLQQMYQEGIPEILYHPPQSWGEPVQLGGPVNPCLVYWIP